MPERGRLNVLMRDAKGEPCEKASFQDNCSELILLCFPSKMSNL